MRRYLRFCFYALMLAGLSCTKEPAPAVKAPAKDTAVVAAKPLPLVKTVKVRADSPTAKENTLPKLVDLGAGKCIPCKMMAPILEELKKDYVGKLDVVFIDVWENSGAGDKYKIRVIPTQIFFAPDGKELFRHEGFFSREDILAKWKEFGVILAGKDVK